MSRPTDFLGSHARLLAVVALLCGCGQVEDSGAKSEALYQPGAAPVAPWTASVRQPSGAVEEEEGEPAEEASSGAMAAAGIGGKTATAGAGGKGGSIGTGGMMGTGGSIGEGSGTAPTKATFTVTTLPQGGRYRPKNAGVIWVQDSAGKYVTTLEVWAQRRANHLHKWLSVNSSGDRADATSSATLRQHKTHAPVWDLKDANGAVVPDGEYTLFIEVTDKSAAGAATSVNFTKGSEPQTATLPDAPYYTGVNLTYE